MMEKRRDEEEKKIHFLTDMEYQDHMRTENRLWREEHVHHGEIFSRDGMKLRYYYALHSKKKGTVVILHGYCGFWGKYHELAEYFWKSGYQVFLLEHRGHGYSGRQIEEKHLVHVNTYEDYVEDVNTFMEQVVSPKSEGGNCILFAHSMGGAIGTLFLEQYPGYFQKAILSSPMYSIKTGNIPKIVIHFLRWKVKCFRQEKEMFPGGNAFSSVPDFETSSTRSKVRYEYIFRQRLEDEHYQTNTFTNGWACESLKATKQLIKNASKIKIPVLLLTSGKDDLVDMDGYEKFIRKVSKVEQIHFEKAKHELFNDVDEVRDTYFSRIFEFMKE